MKKIKNRVRFILACMVACTVLTMPVFAADIVSAVTNVENIVRTVIGSLIGIAAAVLSFKDFLRRSWVQAICILLIGGYLAFQIGAPEFIKSIGTSFGQALAG